MEEKHIPPGDLLPGRVVHEAIPDELRNVVRWQYRHLGYLMEPSYEKWESGFLRDLFIVQEIGLWTNITWSVLEFLKRHPDHDKTAVMKASVGLSLYATPNEYVTAPELEELGELSRSVPRELSDPASPIYDT